LPTLWIRFNPLIFLELEITLKYLKNFVKIISLGGMLLLISTEDAYAYLDPGSFSYVIQVIIAVAVGAIYALKVYWGKIRAFFSKNKEGESATKNE
jgi:hypothetical protein